MRKKIAAFILLALFIPAILSGCKNNQPADTTAQNKAPQTKQTITLKDAALKEKEFLAKVTPIHQKTSDLFSKFEKGAINREQLNKEMTVLKQELDKVKQESSDYYKTHKLSDTDEKDSVYTGGLRFASKLRSALSGVINTTINGKSRVNAEKTDANGDAVIEKVPYDDDKIKTYFLQQEKKYQDNLSKLNTALSKF